MTDPREELRLVTDETELKVGMLIEDRGCGCSDRCRAMIVGVNDSPHSTCEDCDKLKRHCTGFYMLPSCHGDELATCFYTTIQDRDLYEVKDRDQDDAKEREEWKDLESKAKRYLFVLGRG